MEHIKTLDGEVVMVGMEVWHPVTSAWPHSVLGPFVVKKRGTIDLWNDDSSPILGADCYASREACAAVVEESAVKWRKMGYGRC